MKTKAKRRTSSPEPRRSNDDELPSMLPSMRRSHTTDAKERREKIGTGKTPPAALAIAHMLLAQNC
ncbi:unnamed protein product, partial [Chrysoparadoxa australica]